ncbi:hypothetical protein CKO42_00835 [Lamprobacter modestohalophilus]|uniref:DUF484 family protein n=1 Tax=Lamprobacter modestohalophilus TaxID=1064514 RepID=A0A9X0W582_9GAMM|nr:DUF484 family protein [Lamprobacter modestohalophilus]MBK1617017.1 hypothetical protein [Lamprobacter modestohalophilus]
MNSRSNEVASAVSDETVAAWLMRHPDFLLRHRDVLAKLNVPHGSGGATSLIERQVTVLREQLAHERGRLNHLVARAHDYEALLTRLHELTLRLILAPDLLHACNALEQALREQFSADAVAVKLFPVDANERAADPLVRSFADFIDSNRCLCGPFAAEQAGGLFGKLPVEIHSAALIPIRAHEQTGVLAIGSADPKRFASDMGTDLLERLGAVAGAKLASLAHLERVRSV